MGLYELDNRKKQKQFMEQNYILQHLSLMQIFNQQ